MKEKKNPSRESQRIEPDLQATQLSLKILLQNIGSELMLNNSSCCERTENLIARQSLRKPILLKVFAC